MWQPKYLTDKQLEQLVNEEDTITDNMAIDSECEGDSDGEDNMPESVSRSSTSISLRNSDKGLHLTLEQDQQLPSDTETNRVSEHVFLHTNSSDFAPLPSSSTENTSLSRPKRNLQKKQPITYESFSEDSDDSNADPNYEVENASKRRKLYFSEIFEPESSGSEDDEVIEEEVQQETGQGSNIKNRGDQKFDWTKNTQIPDRYSKAQFTENVGPTIDVDIPLSIFLEFLPDTFLIKIVEESNLYAQQLHKNDEFTKITLPELKAFFGILLFMGIPIT